MRVGKITLTDSLEGGKSCGPPVDLASTHVGGTRYKGSSRGFLLSAAVVERGLLAAGIDTGPVVRSDTTVLRRGNNIRRGILSESGLGLEVVSIISME